MQKSPKLILGVILASAVLLGAGVSLLIDIFTNVPNFALLRERVVVPIKLANDEKAEKEMGPKSHGWVPLSQIANPMIMAVIASEDTSFFSHKGVDFHELKEAIKKDWETKSWARGGSTITQQVVKNVFLGRQKTIWRKLKEFFWAQEMEKVLSKSEILCFYLNMAEWGPNIYGIRDAANHYFGVAPSLLTAKQAAFLAMLLPSPKKYHSNFVKKSLTNWASRRVDRILEVMKKMEFIDEQTYELALQEPLWGVESTASKRAVPAQAEDAPEDPSLEEISEVPLEPPVVQDEPSLSDIPNSLPSDQPPVD